jgi:hypothetical protein
MTNSAKPEERTRTAAGKRWDSGAYPRCVVFGRLKFSLTTVKHRAHQNQIKPVSDERCVHSRIRAFAKASLPLSFGVTSGLTIICRNRFLSEHL